ncbi:hypothetical protein LOTGIDRAFT_170840 [Lottia gigantea]|uniref:Glycosyltransferase family 92 protein n=1 Tax=Lottia gigantea TaxID=225164 RepID=V4CPL2_LOTGI|nr:hypothetical protein LOTGIDRAFT_170840 [Lottia gigantea]ESP04340.1 hypothetical protein LOTGIDRAFT_170840 [Lottia gigantea]
MEIINNLQLEFSNLEKPPPTTKGFQPVGDLKNSYVYSAYYDNRSTHDIIQITIMLTHSHSNEDFTCIYWNEHNEPIKLATSIQLNSDWFVPIYNSGFVKCSLQGVKERVTEISLIPNKFRIPHLSYPQNILHIKYPDSYKRNFTRCVPPMFGVKDRLALVQMIETDLLLGTEHFVMYNLRDNGVMDIIQHYQEMGVMEVLTWDLPIPSTSDGEVHYHAQYLHIHDCILRNLYVSRYVFLADIDEVVVPKEFNRWQDIVDNISMPSSSCGSLGFQSAFVLSQETPDKHSYPLKEKAEKYNLTYFTWTKRSQFYPFGDRSKVMVDPRRVWITRVHFVHEFIQSYKDCYVDTQIAFIHHYRLHKTPIAADNYDIHRWSIALIKNIVLVLNKTSNRIILG